MKILTLIKCLLCAALLSVAVWVAVRWPGRDDSSCTQMRKATIEDVRAMARLVSLEIYEDMPLRDSIGPRHIFARVRVRGSIGFDLDSIRADFSGDTVRVKLPQARVVLDEAAVPGSYEVIDTWNDRLLASSYITPAEENLMKRRLKSRVIRRLHDDGTVEKARQDAAASLERLLEMAWQTPVTVE